jgi:hypothetical protein
MRPRGSTRFSRTARRPVPGRPGRRPTPRPGRSSVEGLSAGPSPGLPWPRVSFAGRLRGDKAPDVLVEALTLRHAPPPAYLVGDGPLRDALTGLIRARGWKRWCVCPDGPMSRPAISPGPACTSCPPGRSRGRKAPCRSWDSASRPLAPRSTAGAHPGPGPRRPRPARKPARPRLGAVARAGRRALRPWAGHAPGSSPQRSCRGVRRGLSPAARQPWRIRGANRAAALTPAPAGLKSLSSGLQSWPSINAG